ncbi:magnetosome protein Mad26-1 [Candidatus Magnetomorum sp. HK-1]|nr:magnetosome protein Mad26-1 [Candidatus Magnetomorum sp. HK-1]
MDMITSKMDNAEDTSLTMDELLNNLKELEYNKQFLESENESYKRQLRQLKGELDGINISISSSDALIQSVNEQTYKCLKNIEKLSLKKEQLIDRNSQFHLQIKTASNDNDSSQGLLENLMAEMNSILDEKNLLLNRLNDVKSGLTKLSDARNSRVPEIKKCNDIIRQVYSSMKKVHHKMEISMIFQREVSL